MSQNNSPPSPSKNEQDKPIHSLFCYEVDGIHIFIEAGIKMEVLEQSIIYPIPNAPKWYSGVTSLRGDILIIANMHVLLDAKPNQQKKRLLKLKHPDFPPLVIAIDTLPYQRDMDTLAANKVPNKQHYPEWINSSSIHNNHTYLFADHAALFNAIQDNSTTVQSSGDH
ncbi:MAG: chemotaxis protein CheW [Cocleimonas sp.]|nr:chemotaxis protein CheW [Cocleimonas sp.]